MESPAAAHTLADVLARIETLEVRLAARLDAIEGKAGITDRDRPIGLREVAACIGVAYSTLVWWTQDRGLFERRGLGSLLARKTTSGHYYSTPRKCSQWLESHSISLRRARA